MNGFESANESNGAGLPGPPRVARPMLLALLFVLRDGLMFSCRVDLIAAPARRSGIVTVCTGVMPPKVLLPPQNPLAARRGDVEGRSLCILGVSNDDDVDAVLRAAGEGAEIGRGLGGGRAGEPARPAAPRRAFLSALISCCSVAFSDLVEPSSARIASMSLSRSATSVSRVLMYSIHTGYIKWLNHYKGTIEGWNAHPCDGCGSCGR